jgi:hypothetical protein
MFGKQQVLYFLGRKPLLYFIWQALVAFLYSMFGLAATALFFWQPTCCFFWPTLLSSLFLPMMKLSNSIHYLEYELMIKNL